MSGTSEVVPIEQMGEWAQRLVARGIEKSRDTSPFIKKALLASKQSVAENFESGRSPDGSAWPGVAHPRPRTAGTDHPLRDRGLLLASMIGKGQGHIEEVGPSGFEFGSNLDYAWTHQTGNNGQPITAPPGKALAIPISREAVNYRAREFPRKLILIAREGRPALLVEEKTGRGANNTGARMIIQYVLVHSVMIPARPFAGFGPKLLDNIDELALDHLQNAWGA